MRKLSALLPSVRLHSAGQGVRESQLASADLPSALRILQPRISSTHAVFFLAVCRPPVFVNCTVFQDKQCLITTTSNSPKLFCCCCCCFEFWWMGWSDQPQRNVCMAQKYIDVVFFRSARSCFAFLRELRVLRER